MAAVMEGLPPPYTRARGILSSRSDGEPAARMARSPARSGGRGRPFRVYGGGVRFDLLPAAHDLEERRCGRQVPEFTGQGAGFLVDDLLVIPFGLGPAPLLGGVKPSAKHRDARIVGGNKTVDWFVASVHRVERFTPAGGSMSRGSRAFNASTASSRSISSSSVSAVRLPPPVRLPLCRARRRKGARFRSRRLRERLGAPAGHRSLSSCGAGPNRRCDRARRERPLSRSPVSRPRTPP